MSRDIWYFEEWLDYLGKHRDILSVAAAIVLIAMTIYYLFGV